MMTAHIPPPDDDSDDDLELELESVDPEILEHERRRTLRQVRKAEDSVDINDVYRAADDDPLEFGDFDKFRFTIRHLLIVTAILSVVMTLFRLIDPCNAVAISLGSVVAAGWWFVKRHERQQEQELQRRQKEMKAKIAAHRAAQDSDSGIKAPSPEEVVFDPPPEAPKFRLSFSVKQMFGAFTVAAVILGLISFMGGMNNAALILGTIALLGLAMHAAGFDPPEVIVLSWWLLLVLYIVVSVVAAFASAQAAMAAPPLPLETIFALWVG